MIFLKHKNKMRFFSCLLIICFSQSSSGADYEKDIKPIFENYCYKCHGSEKQKASLRMDSPDAIRKGGKSGLVLLAKNPNESDLLVRIKLPVDHDDSMPGKGKRLESSEIQLIEKWIKNGADFADGKVTQSEDKKKLPPFRLDRFEKDLDFPDNSVIKKLTDSGVLVKPVSTLGKLISVNYKFVEGEVNLQALESLASNIVWLDLGNKMISEEAFKTISKMKLLKRLLLQRSQFDEVHLQSLKGLKNLECINLFNTKVTDESLALFASIKSLKKIYLWQSTISVSGIADLRRKAPFLYIVD